MKNMLFALLFVTIIPLSKQSDNASVNVSPKHQEHRRIRCTKDDPICSNLTSCSGRCSKKRMFHDIKENKDEPSCYCDPECDKIFMDCCADYVEKCSFAKKVLAKKIQKAKWNCVSRKEFPYDVWMVYGCKQDWPKNDTNAKLCPIFLESFPKAKVSVITPVFGAETTFRNRYCALCNGVTKFEPWKFDKLDCEKKVPTRYTEAQKAKHYDKYCDVSSIKFKNQTRGIRYCYDVTTTCQYYHDKKASMDCILGNTGLLSSPMPMGWRIFKNYGCLGCNTKKNENPVNVTCGPRKRIKPLPLHDDIKEPKKGHPFVSFTTILSNDRPLDNQVSPQCGEHQIYDNTAKLCRNLFVYNTTTSNNFLKQVAVRLTFELVNETTSCLNQTINETTSNFLTSLRKKFELYSAETIQNSSWRFHDLDIHSNGNSTLVTFQILKARTFNESIRAEFFTEELKTGMVEVSLGYSGNETFCLYVLRKVETREAMCLDNHTFPVIDTEDFEIRNWNGSIYVNTTEYKWGEYMLYQSQNETRVALCLDTKPLDCLYLLQVKNQSHWKEFANRSVYSLTTTSWYHYGDYSRVNGSLWLCLSRNHTRQTHISALQANTSSIHAIILGYCTAVSFAVSITSLALLLLVYSMFPALRNLPGKNLMLFSSILALAQTGWLVQNALASRWHGLCRTINVVIQFLFLASFSSSFSMAVHSFLTFHALSKGKLRRKSRGGLFLKYTMVAFGIPFLYVVVCLVLDTNNLVPFDYGTSSGHCWFGSNSALYIGFLYPAFVLLLCNMSLLFVTLRVIYKCTKASQKLAEKTGGVNRRQVAVYIRMSTLMGFSWISAVFSIFFPNEIVFEYFFVFVNGLQGFYLSLAFLSTENVRKVVLGRSWMQDTMTTSDDRIKREISTTNM